MSVATEKCDIVVWSFASHNLGVLKFVTVHGVCLSARCVSAAAAVAWQACHAAHYLLCFVPFSRMLLQPSKFLI